MPGPASPTLPAPSISAATCDVLLGDADAAAASIYGQRDDPTFTRAALTTLIACLEIPTLSGEFDATAYQAALGAHEAAVLAFQLDRVASALGEPAFVDIDGLVAGLAAIGVVGSDGNPLSRDAFDQGVAAVAAQADDAHIIPALLLALGRARAELDESEPTDPLWGAPAFDALQLLFMQLGLMAVKPEPVGAMNIGQGVVLARFGPRSAAGGSSTLAQPSARGGAIASWLGPIVNFVPPNSYQPSLAVTCEVLWRTVLSVTLAVNPGSVWHKNGRDPDTTTLEATPTGTPLQGELALAALAGCPFPTTGAGLRSLAYNWTLSPEAGQHGLLSAVGGRLDGDTIQYTTVQETTPQRDQIPPNEHGDVVVVSVRLQIPGSSLPLLGSASLYPVAASIGVRWYEPADYKVEFVTDGIRVHGIYCGVPEGVWLLTMAGSVAGAPGVELSGDIILDLPPAPATVTFPPAPRTGTFRAKYNAYVQGQPLTAETRTEGTATFYDTDPPRLEVIAPPGSALAWARGFEANESGELGKRYAVPIEKGKFCANGVPLP